ncbi:MAG: A/G-specific adenine glycosylase [Planctomycetota bacterium]|jgi:A/G-specific adenine glycosylase
MKLPREQQIAIVQKKLPRWYGRHRRSLPWRKSRDPYAIWVSEIMLQQTRVDQATPYFDRFMKRYPTVQDLAVADQEAVLKSWEGMGYYSRARNLHRAAQIVAEELEGYLPKDTEALRKLPGIGPYTAGAIASIAFGLDEPVLDGNVTRVLTRLFAIGTNPAATNTRKRLWALARKIIPPGKAGDFNQALMDLGAMICLPRNPLCEDCPVLEACRAFRAGNPERYPRKKPRKPVPHETIVAGIIWKKGRILIARRKPEGLLGGLWEFPGGKKEGGETLENALKREILEEVGVKVAIDGLLTEVTHAYSHFRITLHAFECTFLAGRARALGSDAVKWIRPAELDRYAFPAANHKIIEALRSKDPGARKGKETPHG